MRSTLVIKFTSPKKTYEQKKKKKNVRTADPDLHVGPKFALEFATRRHCIKVKYVISFYKK